MSSSSVATTNGHNGSHSTARGSEDTIKSYAPASGVLLGEAPVHSKEDVAQTVARAKRAQAAWGVLPIEERCDRVLQFRDAMVDRADEIIEIISRECGKPKNEALLHEVMPICDLATYFCRNAPRILETKEIPLHLLKHRKSYVRYAPRGVIGIISPWNFPFTIPMGDVICALIAGNAAVVKPSEVTPLTMMKAKEIYDSTGLPEDLFGVVTGFGQTGSALIESGIQKLVFTGGVDTGRRVAAACGQQLIPCVMELGGKAPLIACADADLELTARGIVFGGFANSGQVCVSVERVYAHRDIYEPLVHRVRELVSELKQGDPDKGFVDVGAVTFSKQMEIAERHIDDALTKGAELVIGGKRREGVGQFFEPTVLAKCNHTMTAMTEEIFGPIVPIQMVETEEEAIDLANRSHLGLNAYVFTKDRKKGRIIADRVEAGSVVVNEVLLNHAAPETPFGGFKQSGFGRVHGDDSLRDMAEKRHVNYDRFAMPAKNPLWYPHTEKGYAFFRKSFRTLFGGRGIVQRISSLF
jgi:acyl-CoA reductase-like NAD-dependent aldehyde dehydrogenase